MHNLKVSRSPVQHWYLLTIFGIIFVITGIYTFITPESSLVALSMLFTLSFIAGGLMEIIYSLANRHHIHNWGWSLSNGIITLAIGLLMATTPALSVTILVVYIGFMVMVRSIHAISTGADLKAYGSTPKYLMLAGVLGVILSFLLLCNPVFGGLSIVIWLGTALIISGIAAIVFSFQMKGLNRNFDKVSEELKERYEKTAAEMRNALK